MSLGKHFINDVKNPVERALRFLYHKPPDGASKVLLLSGGGAGHEPAHGGFVGEGMLDICVSGNTFASPSASQVFAGLKAVPSPRGILMIVKNYTGDKLNFGLAAAKAKAVGQRINLVFVGDDVAVEGNGLVGRRGLAGVVFVHKVAGALSSLGADLGTVTSIAQKVADHMATVGVSLNRCSVPQRGKQESLPVDQLEYGMGIHNEPGVRRVKVPSFFETVANVLQLLTKKRSSSWAPGTAHRLAVMINNLGGLSVSELNIVAEEVARQLTEAGFQVRKLLVGTFVSSLDGPGFSVTLLEVDGQIEQLIDAPTAAPAWPKQTTTIGVHDADAQIIQKEDAELYATGRAAPKIPVCSKSVASVIESIASAVQADEPLITRYDTIAGDGDCGETLLNGSIALLAQFGNSTDQTLDLPEVFQTIACTIERSMGGTSGAIYAIYLNAVSAALVKNADTQRPYSALIAEALQSALAELCKYTSAREGHRTIMDALIPFVHVFEESRDLVKAGAAAAKGAESTRSMKALLGRASYVGEEHFKVEGGILDPGAMGFVSVANGICKAIVGARAQG